MRRDRGARGSCGMSIEPVKQEGMRQSLFLLPLRVITFFLSFCYSPHAVRCACRHAAPPWPRCCDEKRKAGEGEGTGRAVLGRDYALQLRQAGAQSYLLSFPFFLSFPPRRCTSRKYVDIFIYHSGGMSQHCCRKRAEQNERKGGETKKRTERKADSG